MPTPLCPIMDSYGSDKGPRKNDSTHHTYTDVYHDLFKDRIGQPLTVFEMGIGTNNTDVPCNMGPNGRPGASLRAWRDYFGKQSLIYGADIDRDVLFTEDRIHTVYCDQLNPAVIRTMWDSLPDMDIIVDDGLHMFEANVTLFEHSIQKLKPNGIYVIEDIQNSNIQRFRSKINEWKVPGRVFDLRILTGGNPNDNNMLIVRQINISVCIPTMRRFSFLKESIPKYLENPHVNELIITDETGEDYMAITAAFSHPKLRVYQNETRLGMLKNKLRAASYATSDFIAIIDSDNFAGVEYFEAFNKFYSSSLPFSSIFLPSAARPNFNFHKWIGLPLTRNNIKQFMPEIETCLNTMNLIISKAFLSSNDILKDKPFCDEIGCYDSFYFTMYALFNLDATLFVVDGMEYEHRVHDESGWLTTHTEFDEAYLRMQKRYLSAPYVTYEMDLLTWQRTYKHTRDLIVQASSRNGHDEWMPFPIGMNYTYSKGNREQFGSHTSTILCAITFSTDHARRPTGVNRPAIINTLAANGIANISLSPTDYYRTLPSYKFVISPEGNGIDCHRHYEALIAGCIPVIERNPLVEEKYRGCPILWTTDYSEITPAYLESKYEEMKTNVYNFSCLFLGFYPPAVQAEIKECGNYWMMKHTNSPFYYAV